MKECNDCDKRGCREVENYRRGKSRLTAVSMQMSCPMAVKPRVWTQPLILCALVNGAQGIHDVLQANDMYFQELAFKPYFRILLSEIH